MARPFDDQTQDRIQLESQAILTILNYCQSRNWSLIGSEIVDFEVSKIPDEDKRQGVSILVSISQATVTVSKDVEKHAIELEDLKFDSFDALHIACAEKSEADVLLTTDDRLLDKALQNISVLKVKVENPVKWLMEVMKNEYSNNESKPD